MPGRPGPRTAGVDRARALSDLGTAGAGWTCALPDPRTAGAGRTRVLSDVRTAGADRTRALPGRPGPRTVRPGHRWSRLDLRIARPAQCRCRPNPRTVGADRTCAVPGQTGPAQCRGRPDLRSAGADRTRALSDLGTAGAGGTCALPDPRTAGAGWARTRLEQCTLLEQAGHAQCLGAGRIRALLEQAGPAHCRTRALPEGRRTRASPGQAESAALPGQAGPCTAGPGYCWGRPDLRIAAPAHCRTRALPTRALPDQAKVRTSRTADGRIRATGALAKPYIVAVSITNRYRTSLATTRSYALSISSAEINSISAPMPCWAQKSSISCVCAMPPIMEPASDLR
ncbi:hypothetical protein FB390_1795 [Nocardia bhagyanarayanae]|uniref:Uncharacterized protein n=1 Tax=Nocardia bhagyanarayanae TaxID=1215925 RepID=A0A543F8L8_9NOCA|nr:hypothetical protein FB390_1795 [Nocardia bhagyanarayanae]